jgi:hypothetical protein
MRPRSWILVAVAALTGSLPTAVHADEGGVCVDAYEKSQMLMKPASGQSTLLPAREMLRTCMRSGCKDWMVADCSRWLSEVEARIPTVVFSVRDTSGRDLAEIVVRTVDGASVASRLDGRAIELEPGEQLFVFVAPDGARREKRVLVREGEKNQGVSAVFDAPPDETNRVVTARHATAGTRAGTPALRYVGYGVTGAGVIGLGVGAIFGLQAIAKKKEANCIENVCDGPAMEEATSAAKIATIGFVAGGTLVAGGALLLLFGPTSSPVQARLDVGPTSARLDLTGKF